MVIERYIASHTKVDSLRAIQRGRFLFLGHLSAGYQKSSPEVPYTYPICRICAAREFFLSFDT